MVSVFMGKQRAILKHTLSVSGIKRGPERNSNDARVKKDLERLKKYYPDFKEATILLEHTRLYTGYTDPLFWESAQ